MLFLSVLLAAPLANQAVDSQRYSGDCIYPPELAKRAPETLLLTCQRAEITATSIAFGLAGWDVETRFHGRFDGNRLDLDSVTLTNGRTVAVRGLCQVSYANSRVSTIACTAVSDAEGSLAVNFVRLG
ncbi:hypothetical protein [Aurantiacibacter luteus]|uniref:Uncharacterized protein n=1 Tax=Aurantiacibacter luteus TaxID=1581420 RepID=A0A0G9MY99_9SPHN|nr:hypothetical protein [Aurantiacibacter luteus]KLE34248.1 hypothetical protein AAW00_08275 [Aurantiacibacter luteus]